MALSEDFLLELRDRADIVSVVSPYVNLKRGSKTYVGLCPFHSEKTPSFNVYPENNSFYCFGCGAGGSAITFISRIENLAYLDAVKSLAQKFGMNMPEDGYDDTLSKRRGRILSANREAAKFFHSTLLSEEGAEALDYLLGRGFTLKSIRGFGMGFAPDRWTALIERLKKDGFNESEMVDANLAKKSTKSGRTSIYDNFRNRIIVPIIDLRGGVIAFGGRVLDDSKPKYINTSDTLIYKKSRELFALNYAKNHISDGKIIIAEGYMDVISLHQAGFKNTVAGLGTALTNEQALLLSRYAKEVILSFDSDEAGQKAVQRAIPILTSAGLKVRVLSLSGGKDPDEIIKNHGRERFQALIDGAANDIEYSILEQRGKFDISTDDGKLGFLKAAVNVLAEEEGMLERDIYASRLADEFSVEKSSILIQVDEARKKLRRQRSRKEQGRLRRAAEMMGLPPNRDAKVSTRASKAENLLLSTLLNNPDFFKKLEGSLHSDDFSDEFCAELFKTLSDRVSKGMGIDTEMLNAFFSPDEMSRIVKLQVDGARVVGSLDVCHDCIKTIKEEKIDVEKINPSELSDDDFNNLFKSIKK